MKEATEKTPKDEYDITAKLHFLHRLANGYLVQQRYSRVGCSTIIEDFL